MIKVESWPNGLGFDLSANGRTVEVLADPLHDVLRARMFVEVPHVDAQGRRGTRETCRYAEIPRPAVIDAEAYRVAFNAALLGEEVD